MIPFDMGHSFSNLLGFFMGNVFDIHFYGV